MAILGLDRHSVFPVVHMVAPWRCEDVGLGWTLFTLLNPTCPPAWFSVVGLLAFVVFLSFLLYLSLVFLFAGSLGGAGLLAFLDCWL